MRAPAAWQELRLGFFGSENDRARAARDSPRRVSQTPSSPSPTIEEQDAAARAPLAGERAHGRPARRLRGGAPPALPELTPERVDALVAEANDAMLAENYDRSIQIYTRLLEEPGFGGRREARERLGIARERKGQVAQARHESASISPSSRTARTRSACVSGSRGSWRRPPRHASESRP